MELVHEVFDYSFVGSFTAMLVLSAALLFSMFD